MTQRGPRRRLWLFLATTFVITWGAWGVLVPLAQRGLLRFGQPAFMFLYVLGGFGPTIAAYVAVLSTRTEDPVREFHHRLFRWRVGWIWYLIAFGLPFAIALGSIGIAGWLERGFLDRLMLQPWHRVFVLFPMMIIGGGLEELGWRGVAQPELERRMNRLPAATVIGIVWVAWHVPLFLIPGVGQHGASLVVFAVGVLGGAFILAWLQAATRSILLCVIFHASLNTAGSMGFEIPGDLTGPAIMDAALKLFLGLGLVVASQHRAPAGGS